MRVKRNRIQWTILAVAVTAVVVLAGASPEGTSRLVSIQTLPENLAACSWDESPEANPDMVESPQEGDLLSALQQEPSVSEDASSAPQAEEPSATLVAALQQDEAPQPGATQRVSREGGPDRFESGGASFVLPNTEEQLKVTAEMRAQGARVPVRTIRDTAPTYSAVAVDVNSNEVILQDNNLWSYRVFDRLSPTPKSDSEISQPKRIVQGDKTALQFNNGLYVDPANGDIYSVESDTGDKMERFPHDASGNVYPTSILHMPHRVYNIAADEGKQELFVTVEFQPEVVVYHKGAAGNEKPLRMLAGENTGLDAPHGIAVDEKDRLLFVNTWGHHSTFKLGESGKFFPPAIKVYPLDADGDTKPLRVITGDKTQLDWPGAMKYNPENGDLYVANDIGQSVLVFANVANVQGDLAPTRVIHGPSTRLRNPTGVALDLKNKEVWVSNLGNSSATVYPLMADGDVSPLRVIRSAEESKVGVNFGRTAAVAYDPIRQEIIVPNCVNHPQIAVFARSATENTPYLRSIEGQKSLLGRTMHDIAFDGIHDEIVVTSPLAQGILSFRGAASGEEAPLRVIQGDRTQLRAQVRKANGPNTYVGAGATAKLAIDPVHNEILLASPDQDILVYDRLANGNVAPKRVLAGPHTQLMLGDQTPIRVDPIHNLLVVPSAGGFGGGKILVYNRTASGDTPPVGFIKGPVRMGEQFDIYAPTMKLVTHTNNNIEIWKIPQSGESDEPPLKIPAPLGRQSADIGITLDPLHKEVIIATAAGNAIMTFYVPEVFQGSPNNPVISLAQPQ